MAEYAAKDSLRRGEDQAIAARRRGGQIKGAQRAALAARGLDLSGGTASDLQDQTDFFSEEDQNMARFNASRDAWAARAQGAQYRAQGDASARQGSMQAFSTLLSTGSQVAGKWDSYTGASSTFPSNTNSGLELTYKNRGG